MHELVIETLTSVDRWPSILTLALCTVVTLELIRVAEGGQPGRGLALTVHPVFSLPAHAANWELLNSDWVVDEIGQEHSVCG